MSESKALDEFTSTFHHDTYPFISPSKTNLSGRCILITGASKGIGRAAAVSFAQAGASGIALVARSSLDETVKLARAAAKEAGRAEPQIVEVKCDTTSEADVDAAKEQITKAFGKLDVLLNIAGYLERWVPLAESDPSEWWKAWEVNVKGTYLMCRAFIPLLLSTPSGLNTIVTASSIGGIGTREHASAYQSGKTAQIRLANFLNKDYEKEGLLAYSIHPGSVMTELAGGMPKYMHELLKDSPQLPGDTLMWLARERRDWLRDRFVSVNWDMEELEARRADVVKKDLLKFKMAF